MPLHGLRLDPRRLPRGQERRPRQGGQVARRERPQSVRARHRDRQGAVHDRPAAARRDAPPQGPAFAARPRPHQVDRSIEGARRARRRRRVHVGGCAPQTVHDRHPRRQSRRSRRHLRARQRRALRRTAHRGSRRGHGRRRRGGLPQARGRLRDPARRLRSRRSDDARSAATARQGRVLARRPSGAEHLPRTARRDRLRRERLRRRRRDLRGDVLRAAPAARPPGDDAGDLVARRGRPLPHPHERSGPVHRALESCASSSG